MGNFKIREFRKAKNIMQGEFAEIVGLSQSNLSRYETNGVDLTDAMMERLRNKFGEEIIAPYMTDSSEQVRDKEIPDSRKDDLTILDLVTIVKRQNEIISRQVESQNELTRQVVGTNDRLLALLEKIQFE